jgi:ornithine cyclodeaminase/alanine dehydrogenase-like protein (mu-crystallin family)
VDDTTVPLAGTETVERLLDYPSLIHSIREAFIHPPVTPNRLAIPIDETEDQPGGTVLVMPALRSGGLLGVKIISIQPKLTARVGGATRAAYIAFDARSGVLKGLIDGHALTLRRTAGTSMLAAQVMARPDPETVLVIGTGALAKSLAEAYAETFSSQRLMIWGRRAGKAQALADQLAAKGIIEVRAAPDLPEALAAADIIASATLAQEPLVLGRHVRPGTHVDLVGGFTPDMREADDHLISRAAVVADVESTLAEAGDLARPIESGVIRKDEIATLGEVLTGVRRARTSPSDITVFKSAGHALEDLAGAELLFQRWKV